MATHQIAQGLAGLGRNGDSMLVHMQPREVAGLQALAKAHGGSLTINPHTGLAEASFLGDVFGAVAPIGLGMLLGPAGLGIASSALGAGMMTGLAGFALSGGDLGAGLSAGLGGAGGFGLGESLGAIGRSATIPTVNTVGTEATAAANAAGQAAKQAAISGGSTISPVGAELAAKQSALNLASGVQPVNMVNEAAKYSMGNVGQGALEVAKDPMKFWNSGQLGWKDAATVASPFVMAGMKPPEYKIPEDTSYKMKYEGPYTAQDRKPRTPTLEEQAAVRAAGSPEYSYFGDSNPYPGFNKAPGYASGGTTATYNGIDGTDAQNTLQDGYGLGRLNRLSDGGMANYAGGGAIAFDAGGQIPNIPQMSMNPTGLAQLANNLPVNSAQPGMPQQPQPGMPQAAAQDPLQSMLQNAITDPMGKIVNKAMGGGIHSLAKGGKTMPGGYLDGAGDGMSDSIPATIGGKQPARLADGEFVIPADVVSHLGNGSTKAGAQHLYKMMDKVRRARTGTAKQGRQINPNKFMPA